MQKTYHSLSHFPTPQATSLLIVYSHGYVLGAETAVRYMCLLSKFVTGRVAAYRAPHGYDQMWLILQPQLVDVSDDAKHHMNKHFRHVASGNDLKINS